MADAGVDQYTFHVEPVEDVSLVCRKVREAGMKVNYFICYHKTYQLYYYYTAEKMKMIVFSIFI